MGSYECKGCGKIMKGLNEANSKIIKCPVCNSRNYWKRKKRGVKIEIKIKPSEYTRILYDEREEIENYTGKEITDVSMLEYQNYLVEKHPDKAKVIR